jgi:acetyl-CoA C-acetyltransferase
VRLIRRAILNRQAVSEPAARLTVRVIVIVGLELRHKLGRQHMSGSVIVAGARTPIGKMQGGLSTFSAPQLGGFAIAAALQRAGVSPDDVDYVIMGQVLLAGAGQLPARQAAVAAGIPLHVPSTIVNKVCLSGLNAIMQADQLIQLGEAEFVVAGGMESMTNAPYLLPDARGGMRLGDRSVIDSMMFDGLTCALDHISMGLSTDRYGVTAGIDRGAQDEFSAQSHERAASAIKDGRFADEIVPVAVPQRKGDPLQFDTDEGVRPGTTAESLGALRPSFDKNGAVTAGNASQISDGASAVIVMSKAKAEQLGVQPLGEVVSYGMVAGPDTSLLQQPSRAIKRALERAGLTVSQLALLEMNEAFASVALASMTDLGVTDEIVNVNGGAIALGHPIGASGNRLALTLLHELRRRGGGLGAAALCGGGGQGDAIVLRAY